MKQLGFILALIFILMPMASLAQDRISENLNLKNELYLKSFDFEPKQIDTRDSEQTVNFLATIYAKNGLMNNSSTGFATQATFLGPYSFGKWFAKPEKNVVFLPPPILGDAINGTYKKAMIFPKGTAEGVWQLESIKLVDSKGQVRELKGDDLESLPQELNVNLGGRKKAMILAGIPFVFAVILISIFGIWKRYIRNHDWFLGDKEDTEKTKGISTTYKGQDGATSSSKSQFLLWVFVILYAYIIIISDAYMNHRILSLGLSVPDNLLLAMGLSTTTMLAAKGITSKYAEEGELDKSYESDAKQKGGLFFDDRGYPDLSQIQLISWTVIGVGIFLLKSLDAIFSPGAVTGLPDIDQTLLMLMGIGQGAYIGKKIITKDTPPELTGLSPGEGSKASKITITGTNFGDKPSGCSITIGDNVVKFKKEISLKWEKGKVEFKLDDIDFTENEWKEFDKEKIKQIGIKVGNMSSNKKPFKIVQPELTGLSPEKGSKASKITITGTNFGDKPSECSITIGDNVIKFKKEISLKWEKGKVEFKLDDIDFTENEWKEFDKEKIKQIGIKVGKTSSNKMPFEIESSDTDDS